MDSYTILFEDEDILVANKLGTLPVQPEKSGDASLQDLLRGELETRGQGIFLEAAHRIDRRASGAIIFAKTRRSLETLEADFRAKRVGKTYIACVEKEPQPAAGRLEHRLFWDKKKNIVRALPMDLKARGEKGAKLEEAILDYRLAGRSERYFFLEIDLITGRHHQIRAQLAAMGNPIRGDIKYGARRTAKNGLIMLHARKLRLTQPRTREELEIIAPFPPSEALWAAFEKPAGEPSAESPTSLAL